MNQDPKQIEEKPLELSEAEFVKLRQRLFDAAIDQPDSLALMSCKKLNRLIECAVNTLRLSVEVIADATCSAMGRKGGWEKHLDVLAMLAPYFLE